MPKDYHGDVRRFTYDGQVHAGSSQSLDGPLRHRLRVARMAPDEIFLLLDASGALHRASVSRQGKHWTLHCLDKVTKPPATGPILLLALSRPEALRRATRASVELGASEIHLVRAQRSQRDPSKNLELALERVAQSALEQSQAPHLPQLQFHDSLAQALDQVPRGAIAQPGSPQGAQPWPSLAVGPEGGWHLKELQEFQSAGWASLGLPGNILRVETAVAVGLALIRATS